MTNRELTNWVWRKLCIERDFRLSSEALESLRLAAIRIHTFTEHECNGAIQRDPQTGIPYWHDTMTGERLGRARDMEKAARKRIRAICNNYPDIVPYIQSDPRGGTLYLIPARLCDPARTNLDAIYSRHGYFVW